MMTRTEALWLIKGLGITDEIAACHIMQIMRRESIRDLSLSDFSDVVSQRCKETVSLRHERGPVP